MVSGEPDWQGRFKGLTDLWYVKGVTLKDPTVAAAVPTSVENLAIAYNAAFNAFRVYVEGLKGTPARRYDTTSGELVAAPQSGYKIRVYGFMIANESDEITRLRYGGVTGTVFAVLPLKGMIGMNLMNIKEAGGDAENIYVEKTGIGNVLAVAWVETVAV